MTKTSTCKKFINCEKKIVFKVNTKVAGPKKRSISLEKKNNHIDLNVLQNLKLFRLP